MTATAPRGLIPILATPFDRSGALDLDSLRRLAEFTVAAGVDGVATFGMASEAFTLTSAERATVLDTLLATVRQTSGPELPIIAGVNATGTAPAVEQAVAARDGGADALMVLPPYLVKPDPDQILAFYAQVAEKARLPVIVQDAPGTTGVPLPPSLIVELGKLDGVASVKVEAPPTARKVAAIVDALAGAGAHLAVLGGQNALFALEEYDGGAVGTMPACEFVDPLREVLDLWSRGDRAAARGSFARLLPLIRFGMQMPLAWAVHKQVLVRRGIISSPYVRLPAAPLDQRALRMLHELLDDLNLPLFEPSAGGR